MQWSHYKIQNINTLANDNNVEPTERCITAMRKFGRMSLSEVVTPITIASDMIANLPQEGIDSNSKILDINSKQGEFAIALYKRFGDIVKDNVYSIPSSAIAYEFTRKIYEALCMPIKNIYTDFISYDIIKEKNKKIIEQLSDMKFNTIVGNPPYQETTQGTSDKPIYHLFMDIAFELSDKVSFITPARFLFNAGKTPKAWNNKVLSDEHFKVVWDESDSTNVFPRVDIKGGVAVTYRDANKTFGNIGTHTSYPELNSTLKKVIASKSFASIVDIIHLQNKFNLSVLYTDYDSYKKIIGSSGKEKRLTTSIFETLDIFTENNLYGDGSLKILGLINNNRVYRFLPPKYVDTHINTYKYKVILPKSNGSGAIGEVLSTPLIGEPLIGFTQSFISIGAFETEAEAGAALKYVKSKFARAMLGILKVTQDNNKDTWKFVPLQDFTEKSDIDWSKTVAEIDQQLYAKYGLSAEEIAFVESMIKPMS